MGKNQRAVIVLCAGAGKRMGGKLPKMLLPLKGRPILFWTLKAIVETRLFGELAVTYPQGYVAEFKKAIRPFARKVLLVPGGEERADSTRNALNVLQPYDWVAIHDGARPFVPKALWLDLFKAAKKTGVAIPAVPVKDTVKRVNSKGLVEATLPRKTLVLVQTPQVLKRKAAWAIHSGKLVGEFTDDASMAEALGYKVQTVLGSYENIKITTPEDLLWAESFLKRRRRI
jgi:2-C-methyl-D-erythritol 4-phosphate cytidylyltransferase